MDSKEANGEKGVEHHDSIASEPQKFVVDEYLEKRISRKFDIHLLPWLFGIWLLAFIDRSNVGNAAVAGLEEDLGLKSTQYNTALAIFYIPYIIVDVPSNWIVKKVGAGYYIPFMITAWGLVSTFTGFVQDFGGFVAARFFLGLAEGGLLGGIVLYLSMFYPRHQLMYRIALFYCGAPLAGAIGGILAAGLAMIETPGYPGWPFIFFVEGALTVVFGAIATLFLPHTPEKAKFLSQNERTYAAGRLSADVHQGQSSLPSSTTIEEDKFSWHWVKMALLNWNTALLSLNFFLIITPIYSFSLFLPLIIVELVGDPTTAQLFTIPPNICGVITVLLAGHFSDRLHKRGYFMLAGSAVGLIGYIMLIASAEPYIQWGGTFFVAAGIFPCSPIVMGWLANNLHPHYVRATGTGFQIAIANLAAFIATFTYVNGQYTTGHAINLAMLVATFALTLIIVFYQKWENKKRDAGDRDGRLKEEDEGLLGCRHPAFRYTI